MLKVTVETWMSNAAAVLSGTWGAVTRRSHPSGSSCIPLSLHAHRVGQAVASAQACGISSDALGQANEPRQAENAALGPAWAAAEDLCEAKQRAVAGSGAALGGSLSHMVTLLAIIVPQGLVPSRATGGRWVQQAAAPAGRLLVVRAVACQARGRGLCLDESLLQREPVWLAIDPESMAWLVGSGGRTAAGSVRLRASLPGLEPVVADGGQGLERGGQLAQAARGP